MTASPVTRHNLRRQTALRLAEPVRVRVTAGTLWLTLDGDPVDHVLEPGECLALDGREPAVLTALGTDVIFELMPLAAPSFRAAGWRKLWRDGPRGLARSLAHP
jgi:hypothetical protein